MLYLQQPIEFENPQKIVGCFVEYQGKILLLRRQTHKQHGNDFGPPGGKVEATDESIAHAMARELFEETGLQIDHADIEFIVPFYVKYPDGKDFVYYQYRVVLDTLPEIILSHTEHSGHVWVTPDEALTLPLIHDEDSCIKHVYQRQ